MTVPVALFGTVSCALRSLCPNEDSDCPLEKVPLVAVKL